MTDSATRICTFWRRLALLALLAVAALWAFPAKAALNRDSTAASAAESDLLTDYAHGLFLDMKGDYWGAIDALQKVSARQTANAAVKYSISKSYFSLAVLDSAKVYGEAAVRLDPSNRHYLRYLAGLAHEMKAYDRAAELLGQASILEPTRAEILYLQGLEYFAAKKAEPALEAFEKAARIDPYNEAALTQTLTLQIGLKRYADAIETAKHLLEIGGNAQKLGLTLADLYAKTGQETLALQTLRELAEANHGEIVFRIALFDHSIKAGRSDDFHRELTAFLDKESPSKESLHDFARLFISRSAKDSLFVAPALELLDELIARNPRDSKLYMLKGMYFMVRERQPEGLELLAKAVQLDAGNVTAWEYLITARLESGDKRKAFELLAQAKRKLPGERLRWSAIEGYMLLYTNAPKRAVAVLEKVVGTKRKHPDKKLLIEANNNLAMACDQLGKKKQCRDAYERVLELDPHNTLAMNNLAYMLAEEGFRLRHALRLASNAVLLEPDNGVYLDTLGWVHHKLGNNELARQLLEKAISTGVNEADVYRHLAEDYRKLGYEAKAKEMLEKAKGVKK